MQQLQFSREAVLAELGRIARNEFHGCVTRNMITSLYVARRRPRQSALLTGWHYDGYPA